MTSVLSRSTYLVRTAAALSSTWLVAACSSAGNPPPSAEPTVPVQGSDASLGVPDASDGGMEAEGAAALDANFTDLDAAAFLCNPYGKWGPGQAIPGLPSNGTATALAITPDELTLAWIDSTDGGALSYNVIDRASVSAPFAIADAQPLALETYAAGELGISLRSDGLGVAIVKADHLGFGQMNRGSRTDVFAAPDESPFASVNAWVGELGGTVADPAFGADGQSFLYSQFGAEVTLYESRATSSGDGGQDVWVVGTPLGGPALTVVTMPPDAGGTLYRHPSSLSADGLVVFLRDEYPTSTARSVYRTSMGAAFGPSVTLGSWGAVHPNAACTALYYIENGDMKVSPKI
jgi:hypothetical protein